jgi:hypothetical protein
MFAWEIDTWQSLEVIRSLEKIGSCNEVAEQLERVLSSHPSRPVRSFAAEVRRRLFPARPDADDG